MKSLFSILPFVVGLQLSSPNPLTNIELRPTAGHCFPDAFIGTWHRVTPPIQEQMSFWPSGDYNDVLNDPDTDESGGHSSACHIGDDWVPRIEDTVNQRYGFLSHPRFSEDGNTLFLYRDHVIYGHNGRNTTLSAAEAMITFRRVEEYPKVDWRAHARDGGYTWDFKHACPANPDPSYHALIPGLVDNTLAWRSDGSTHRPFIVLEENDDGTLLWQFGKHDRLRERRFCRPDDHTLVVEQPGPKGVSIPHRYEVFDVGGLIYFNGLQVNYRYRSDL